MNSPAKSSRSLLSELIFSILCGCLATSVTLAQPAAETTFTNTSGNLWGTAGNWDNGLPDPLSTSLDDALIASGQLVQYSETLDGVAFGTLTLGTNATMQITNVVNAATVLEGKNIYLNDGSLIEFTSGSFNRNSGSFNMLSGTSTLKGNLAMVKGTIAGSGNLDVVLSGNNEWRATGTTLSGDLTITSSNTTGRRIGPSRFSGTTVFGTGTATIGDNVYLWGTINGSISNSSNKLNGLDTLRLLGDTAGSANAKFDLKGMNNTVGNLVVESVGDLTGTSPLLRSGTSSAASTLTVTNTVTFTGTASNVEIDNAMTTPTGNSLVTGNLTFEGAGNWSVVGDGAISLSSGAAITTSGVDASIANPLVASNGFTKAGTGSLTLTGDNSGIAGNINVTGGELAMTGALNNASITLAAGADLGIGAADSAADTLNLGSGALALGEGSTINWQFNGATTAGSDYDTIISSATLDLTSLTNIIIDGTSLGYVAQIGDTFTLFDGTVNGFDASKFTLNLPTLTEGTWSIQEGSLQLVVVPEPSVALLGGLGMLGLLMRRRNR